MSQRLAHVGISLPPHTVVGHRKNGTPIFNIAGGSVDAGTEEQAGAEGTPDPEGTDTGEASDSTTKPLSAEEAAALTERMKAADRRASAKEQELTQALAKLKEHEDRDKTELERATADAEQSRKEAEDAKSALRAQRINNAFLTSNKFTWHNSERAMSLLDLSEVTISDDGTVVGLEKAIDALAKSDPYLIKTDDSEQRSPGTPSGTPAGSGTGKGKPAANSRESLMDKYPALRR